MARPLRGERQEPEPKDNAGLPAESQIPMIKTHGNTSTSLTIYCRHRRVHVLLKSTAILSKQLRTYIFCKQPNLEINVAIVSQQIILVLNT